MFDMIKELAPWALVALLGLVCFLFRGEARKRLELRRHKKKEKTEVKAAEEKKEEKIDEIKNLDNPADIAAGLDRLREKSRNRTRR